MTEATEEQLIERARLALSECNWTIGECASIWTRRYARGRSDQAFAELLGLGLSADQVYQRRRVWETFADVRGSYTNLSWSHFYSATSWDDAAECLQWADDMEATVAEMRAWRRAQRGEDLSEPEDNRLGSEVEQLQETAALSGPERTESKPVTMSEVVGAESSRSSDGPSPAAAYAPFATGTQSVAKKSEPTATRADADRLARTLALTLERCVAAIEKQPGVSDECSEDLWDRVQRALQTMQADWNSPARIH